MDPNWLWLIPVLGFLALEWWGLRSDEDRAQPLTYWIRKSFSLSNGVRSVGWWITAGILGWLVYHFLAERG